jgi:tetratricopeptide (TPR) repeat protein
MLGNNRQAFSYCRKALEMHRDLGDRLGEAATLDSLGYCCQQAGRHHQAIEFYQQALTVYTAAGDRYCRVPTLVRLGETYRASGNSEATRDLWQQALAILDGVRDPGAGLIRAKLRTMNLVLD